jgi:hypothetical protein
VSGLVSAVAFVGSRVLPSALAAVVPSVVRAVASCWPSARLLVGCCAGADAAVVSSALSSGLARRLSLFAVFGPSGAGAVRPVSAVGPVLSAASAGASVSWFAGGSLALPPRARLARRSLAVVAAAAASGPALLVAFLAPGSRGSVLACAAASGSGLPVLAFAVGPGVPAALPGVAGSWRLLPCLSFGVVLAWSWRPDQEPLWSECYSEDIESW